MLVIKTGIGNSVELDENSIIYRQIEGIEQKDPLITSNFAKNVKDGYLVVSEPEHIESILLQTVAREHYDLAEAFVIGIEEANRQEQNKLDEHDLESQVWEEEHRESPLGLIFDAIEKKGKPIRAIRSQYEKEGKLSDLRKGFLLTMLSQLGFGDEVLQHDVKAIIDGDDLIDKEGTWKRLTEDLGVVIPEYSKPPEIQFKEIPPILEELEAVVKASYREIPLEDISLTRKIWNDAGMDARDIYSLIEKEVIKLKDHNDQYILVKVLGSDSKPGNLDVLQPQNSKNRLKNSTPRSLRANLRVPIDVYTDAYALAMLLSGCLRSYADQIDEKVAKEPDSKLELGYSGLRRFLNNEAFVNSVYPQISAFRLDNKLTAYGDVLDKLEKSILEEGLLNVRIETENTRATVPFLEMADRINYLVGLLPPEFIELMESRLILNECSAWLKDHVANERSGKILTSEGLYIFNHTKELKEQHSYKRDMLTTELGSLADGVAKFKTYLNGMMGDEMIKRLKVHDLELKTYHEQPSIE